VSDLIITVGWNGREELHRCLARVLEGTAERLVASLLQSVRDKIGRRHRHDFVIRV